MDIFIISIAVLLLIAGIAGCVLPVIPGPPLAYASLLLLHFTDKASFSTPQLVGWLLLVILLQVLDYITPLLGSKYSGGTKYGNRGCIVGTILGLFFMPWGIIVGPFVGAVVGELLGGNDMQHAIHSGIGTLIGFVLCTLLKFVVCFYFLHHLVSALM